jgi:hypothetical protein
VATPSSCREIDLTPGKQSRAIAPVIAAVTSVVAPLSAAASQWTLAPQLSSSVGYSTNRGLTLEAEESGTLYTQASASLVRATESSDLTFGGFGTFYRYTAGEPERAVYAGASLAGEWRLERTSIEASVLHTYNSDLSDELDTVNLLRGGYSQRTTTIDAGWSLQRHERAQFFVLGSFTDVENDTRNSLQSNDYTYPTLSVGERRVLTDRTQIIVSAFAANLRTQDLRGDTREAGVQVGIDHELSQRLSVAASLGYSEQRSDFKSNSGYLAKLWLTREGPRTRWSVGAERRNIPTSLGRLVQRDEAGFFMTHELSPRMSMSINAQAVRNQNLGFGVAGEDWRSYEAVDVGLQWQSSTTTILSLRLGGARGQRPYETQTVDGLIAAIAISWTPVPKIL